jgi:hypothetical protein
MKPIMKMWLILEDLPATIPVAKLRKDGLVLEEPYEHPPGDGEMILQIEPALEHRWRVRLLQIADKPEPKPRIKTIKNERPIPQKGTNLLDRPIPQEGEQIPLRLRVRRPALAGWSEDSGCRVYQGSRAGQGMRRG